MSALRAIERLMAEWTGIDLSRGGQRPHLERFVAERRRALGLESDAAYCRALAGPTHPEAKRLIEAITVGTTWFFRDRGQLSAVEAMLESPPRGSAARVWVAGCSTGEDAYSVAMIARRAGRDLILLATDINGASIETARAGRYGPRSTLSVPDEMRPYLRPLPGGVVEVEPEIRRAVRFERHNLLDAPPAQGAGATGWDLILCRNVLMYFDPTAIPAVIQRLERALAPNGRLLLAPAEALTHSPASMGYVELGGRVALSRLPPAQGTPAAAPPTVPAAVEDSPTGLDRVAALLRAGRAADAEELCSPIVEHHPRSALARLLLGVAEHLMGDPTGAAAALEQALALDQTLWPAAYFLAMSYDRLGLPGAARTQYRRAAEAAAAVPTPGWAGALGDDLEEWRLMLSGTAAQRALIGSRGEQGCRDHEKRS